MTRYADDLYTRCDVTLSEQEGGEVRCNLGFVDTGDGIAASAVLWGVDGFYTMPNPPSAEGACEALVQTGGDKRWVVATKDVRWAAKVGNIAPGDRMIASDCDARIMLRRAKNQVAIYSANKTDDDSTMLVEVNGESGEIQMVNGGAVIRMTKDKIQFAAGGAVLELGDGTIGVYGAHFACNTGGGNFGTIGPFPPPPSTNSILAGPSGVAGVMSAKWTVALAFVIAVNFLAWIYNLKT